MSARLVKLRKESSISETAVSTCTGKNTAVGVVISIRPHPFARMQTGVHFVCECTCQCV